jgi:hypothetical protein
MIEQLSQQLTELSEKKKLKDKLLRDLKETQKKINEEVPRLRAQKIRLQREKEDVERLEGLSLKALFTTILGGREDQIEKERQEYLLAEMKTRQIEKVVNALNQDADRLNYELGSLENVEEEFEIVLQKKEDYLLKNNQDAARGIMDASEEIATKLSMIREIEEALSAGHSVLTGLNQVVDNLQQARNWGTWDMLGGGMISSIVKHDRIDEARNSVEHVQVELLRFQRELADVHHTSELKVELTSLERFADLFLDGLIIDWVVQSKINQSLEEAVQMRLQVKNIVDTLLARKKTALKQLEELRNKKTGLVENL